VTGVDFIPRALEMARARAAAARVRIRFVHADLLTWQSPDRYDLVLDSGRLHTIRSRHLTRYKSQLLSWLLPGADFILAHFGKRHVFDWRPIGPRRRPREALVRLFAPEIQERAYDTKIMTGIPLPIGPTVLGQCFWFQRAG
jgi:SAM-dependent methyltransferase